MTRSWRDRTFTHHAAARAVLMAALFAIAPALVEGDAASAAEPSDGTLPPIAYVPPPMGAPGGRVGAATRDLPDAPLRALAPEGGGYTAGASPVLYWASARPVRGRLRFVLGAHGAKPLVVIVNQVVSLPAGTHQVRLADHGLRLVEGTVYRWAVTVWPEGGGARQEAVSYIARRRAGSALRTAVKDRGPAEAARAYAAAGFWYDALALLMTDARHRALRHALLRQTGIALD